jgi:hypothetical protein
MANWILTSHVRVLSHIAQTRVGTRPTACRRARGASLTRRRPRAWPRGPAAGAGLCPRCGCQPSPRPSRQGQHADGILIAAQPDAQPRLNAENSG